MIISLIVAMDENRGIGINNSLPWHVSSDLRRFKRLTMGHHLIIGRLTYESIGRPLPGRTNIVLTRNQAFQAEGCLIAHTLTRAFRLAEEHGETEVFVIGGADVFDQALEDADRIYLTEVNADVDADVHFPVLELEEWREIISIQQEAGVRDEYSSTFRLLARIGTALDNLDYSRIISPT